MSKLSEDTIYNRKVLLEAMDNYITNVIGIEDVSLEWWEDGIPSDADDDIYTDIAEDPNLWTDVVKVFARIVRREE